MPDERSIDEVVAEVRRRAEYASPGPWRLDYTEMPDGSPIWRIWIKRSIGSYAVTSHPTSWCVEEQRASDAEYIATVDPTTVLRLCDEIERLRRELDGWQQATAVAAGIPADAVDRPWRTFMTTKQDE